MADTAITTESARLARFLERAGRSSRNDQEAIVKRLIDRLDAIDRADEWRMVA